MEPAFLDKLPPRFRSRFRDNRIAIGFIVAAFVVPPRCGHYGVDAFFSIVWFGLTVFLVSRMVKAKPRCPAWSFVLLSVLLAVWAYPICIGWRTVDFGPDGVLAFFAGSVLYIVLLIVERRVILATLFGSDRSNPIKDWRAIRAAQAAACTEPADRMRSLIDEFRKK